MSTSSPVPLEPPDTSPSQIDIETTSKPSNKEILRNEIVTLTLNPFPELLTQLSKALGEEIGEAIQLAPEEKIRLYTPWRYSVIIKVVG